MKGKKIDVEESKRLGRIVTKEVDINDPDYELYQHVGEEDSLFDQASLDCPWAPDYNDGIVSILGAIMLLIIAPGFVILSARYAMDITATVFLVILFLMLSSINVFIPYARWNEKDYATKQICKVVAFKTIILVVWTAIFTLIPAITNANIAGDTAASNRYIMLYAIYIVLFAIDNFLGLILLNVREAHYDVSRKIDKICVAVEAIILWGYGAIISILLFKDIKMIVLFNSLFLIASFGFAILNFFMRKNKEDIQVDKAIIDGLVKESKRVLIVFFICFIALLIWWIVCFFKMLK